MRFRSRWRLVSDDQRRPARWCRQPFPDGAEGSSIERIPTGSDALMEIPMSSFQCKRRRGASTWLVVESPGAARPGRPDPSQDRAWRFDSDLLRDP